MHNEDIAETFRELIESHRQLSIQHLALSHILYALLNVIGQSELQQLKRLLETQVAGDELQGVGAEALRLSVQIVSLATDDDEAPDPRKLLRLIKGGKDS